MIIRLTVHDNDFYHTIMPFMKYFREYIFCEYSEEPSDEELARYAKLRRSPMREWLNPNNSHVLSLEERDVLINRIREAFNEYLTFSVKDEDTRNYLSKNLDVSIIDSFDDKWENGETFYWLLHSSVVVNQ